MALGKTEQLASWRTDAIEHLSVVTVVRLLLGYLGYRLLVQLRRAEQKERNNAAETAVFNLHLSRLSRHLAKARDRAEQANRAKTRFLAGMGHELRTLLNGIIGFAHLLGVQGGLAPNQASRIDVMLAADKHFLEMITALLSFSEIESEHLMLHPTELNLRDVAAACLDLVRPMA